MSDTNNNITIDITGNTASMATDYGLSGVCMGSTHVPLSKVVWGDNDNGKRVDLSNPLPIQVAGQTGPIEIFGNISGTTSGSVQIKNFMDVGSSLLNYVAVAGSTNGSELVGITGYVQGMTNGIAIAITGDVKIYGSMAPRGVMIQGTSAGATATINGEIYPGYGYGVPVAVTGGRRLSHTTDSIRIDNTTIGISGGRELTAATDSVSVYGFDGSSVVRTSLHSGSSGITAGFSGDALKVAIVNAAEGITFNVSVQAITGVTNAGEPPLRVQGFDADSSYDPIIVQGTNSGALEVFANTPLYTNILNSVEIQDSAIIASLENTSKPLISNLSKIKSNTNSIGSIHTDITTGRGVKAKITEIEKPNTIRSGSKIINGNMSAQSLDGNLEVKSGITVKLSPNSRSNVLIGNRNLSNNINNGYMLEPGESIYIEINNINKIFVKCEDTSPNADATLYYIGS